MRKGDKMKVKLTKSTVGWIVCPIITLLFIGAIGLEGTLQTICVVAFFTIVISALLRLFWAIGTDE